MKVSRSSVPEAMASLPTMPERSPLAALGRSAAK
jgi:hypothetical protein